jgi:hypothetical protein
MAPFRAFSTTTCAGRRRRCRGGGVRRGRRAVLEQAVLVFERFSSVVVERMSTSVVGDWATVRGRYRTMQGRRVDFVERIHIKDGRIVALRGSMRTDQVARRRARATPTVTTARVGDAWGAARSSSRTARAEDKRDGVGRPRPGLSQGEGAAGLRQAQAPLGRHTAGEARLIRSSARQRRRSRCCCRLRACPQRSGAA